MHTAGNRVIVLHVEDEQAPRESIAALLKSSGYETLSAADGPSALLWVTERSMSPDVLIFHQM